MPASHTSASLFPGLLPAATQAPTTVTVRATWPVPFRVTAGESGGARGRITGTVKIKGTPDYPVSRRVRLYRELDGALVAQTFSDPITGEYEFDGVNVSLRYTALAYDHTYNFRAVVSDNLTPEAA